MFYSNTKQVEHDYYNSYNNSRHAVRHHSLLNTVIKVLIILFLVTLIISGYVYIMKSQHVVNAQLPHPEVRFEVKEESVREEHFIEEMAKDFENKAERDQLSNEEISKIVQVVVAQLKGLEKKNPLTTSSPMKPELHAVNDDNSFVKALMSVEVERGDFDQKKIALKDINHYNKVVVQSDNQIQKVTDDPLSQLNGELENVIGTSSDLPTNYTQSITREIEVRSNEMRVIIVKKGDTLSKLANRAYGDPDAYTKIYAANPEVLNNPNQIFIGQRLRIPR